MTAAPPAPTSAAKHVPERTCVACRSKRPQAAFRRVTRLGDVWTVQGGVRSGRGAYVCADSPACWQEKKLRRAFGAQAPLVAAQLLALSPTSPASPHTSTSMDQPMTT